MGSEMCIRDRLRQTSSPINDLEGGHKSCSAWLIVLWGHIMKASAAVAQLGERGTEDPEVAGSIPAGGTTSFKENKRKHVH